MYFGGPGLQQAAAEFIGGGAGGDDIVDDSNTLAIKSPVHPEYSPEVALALGSAEGLLGLAVASAPDRAVDGDSKLL